MEQDDNKKEIYASMARLCIKTQCAIQSVYPDNTIEAMIILRDLLDTYIEAAEEIRNTVTPQ